MRTALAVRIGYVGELGYELYVPQEYAVHVYETLREAGEPHGIADAGYRAIDACRMEKGYLYWSGDITPDYNPYEAGLGFAVALEKGEFIGREALARIKGEGVRRKLCSFTIDGFAPFHGGEAILFGGKVVGSTSSTGYGYTLGKTIAFGYLPVELAGESRVRDRGLRQGLPGDARPAHALRSEDGKAEGMSDGCFARPTSHGDDPAVEGFQRRDRAARRPHQSGVPRRRDFCLRIPGKGTEEYINRANEAVAAREAAKAGVSPDVLHFDGKTGVMVTRFVAGAQTMSPAKFKTRPGSPARAGEAFRQAARHRVRRSISASNCLR